MLMLYITPQYAHAQYFTGPVAASYGNAGRAASNSAESLFINPATIALTEEADAAFFYHDGYISDDKHDKLLGLSIVDNHEGSYLPGALSYIKRRRTLGPGRPGVDEDLWQFSLAKSFQNWSVGLSLYRLAQDQDLTPDKIVQWSGNAGLLFQVNHQLQFGLSCSNVVRDQDKDLPAYLEQVPTWGFGGQYRVNEFMTVRSDLSYTSYYNPDHDINFHFGFESKLQEFNAIRIGYNRDGLSDYDIFSLGWSFLGPRFSLNYTIQKNSATQEA